MDSILKSELTNVRDQCDWIDYPGTPGKPRLRDTCRLELGHFLLYIADAEPFPSMEQEMLINTVWSGVRPSVSRFGMQKELRELGLPDASENETLAAFVKAGKADRLIRLYKVYGGFMASLSRNSASERRYNSYMDEMRDLAGKKDGE